MQGCQHCTPAAFIKIKYSSSTFRRFVNTFYQAAICDEVCPITRTHARTHTHTHAHTHTHTHLYTHLHTHTHTRTQLLVTRVCVMWKYEYMSIVPSAIYIVPLYMGMVRYRRVYVCVCVVVCASDASNASDASDASNASDTSDACK